MAVTKSLSTFEAAKEITRTNDTLGSAIGVGTTVTYGFIDNPMFAYSADQIAGTQLALALWSDVANINFVQANGPNDQPYTPASPNIRLQFVNYNDANSGSGLHQTQADGTHTIGVNQAWSGYSTTVTIGDGMFDTLIHETGHAIGLEHPGPYNYPPKPTYGVNNTYIEDSLQYSVMSYFSATNTGGNHGNASVSSPLLHDIAAAQRLYGANLETRTGATTYGFNSNANGGGGQVFHIEAGTQDVVFAIWDAGGTDTLDLSGYADDQRIDLEPGSFSDVGGLRNNFAMAEAVSISVDQNGTVRSYLRGDPNFNPNTIVNYIENATGGSGNDTISGNGVRNVLAGGIGSDRLFGWDGNDVLNGGAGNDTLDGGSGADQMAGGLGNDTYIVGVGDTVIEPFAYTVNDPILGSLKAPGGTDTVKTSIDQYSLAGTGIENLTFVDNDPFTVITFTGRGNELNNIIKGNTGVDVLAGYAGTDVLEGGAGGDSLAGGTEFDFASYEGATARVVVDLQGGVRQGDAAGDQFNSIEGLIGSRFGDELGGDGGNNELRGGEGNDTLSGYAGHDTLNGGAGADNMRGGAGNDTYHVDDAGDRAIEASGFGKNPADPGGIDTVVVWRETYTLENRIENMIIARLDGAKVKGNALANTITGGVEQDEIEGGAGNDRLLGGGDYDRFIYAGAVSAIGSDTIDGAAPGTTDTALDELDFSKLSGRVNVNLMTGRFTATDGTTTVTSGAIVNVGNVVGTINGDAIIGDGGHNEINGNGGADIINGGGGDDGVYGGAGQDTFVFDATWTPTTSTRGEQIGDFTDGEDLIDLRQAAGLTSFDDLDIVYTTIGTSTYARITTDDGRRISVYDIAPNSLDADDFLFAGQTDKRTIVGGAGSDTLIGNGLKNLIQGLGGNDMLLGLGAADILDGGVGYDTVSYAGSGAAVRVNLALNIALGGDAEGDRFIGIERVIGSDHNDILRGGTGNDRLEGAGGRNDVYGADGNDVLVGGTWFDTMDGGAGNDTIVGTSGQTVQYGRAGDDRLTGSVNNANYFEGGTGNDIITGGNTTDYIADTELNGGDDIMYGNGGNDTLVDYYGINKLYGGDGNDQLSSSAGGYLDGGAGDDFVSAVNGGNTLIGGTGNDRLEIQGGGFNTMTGGAGVDLFSYHIGNNGPQITTVTDFEDGIDHILLWDYAVNGNVPLEDLTIADSAAGAVISWNGTNQMTLSGILANQLTPADFVFTYA